MEKTCTKSLMAVGREDDSLYCINIVFEVPDPDFDILQAVKDASMDFIINTKEGRNAFELTGGYWNLADFDIYVPESICGDHGFKKIASNVSDGEIDFDMQLIDEDEINAEVEINKDAINDGAGGSIRKQALNTVSAEFHSVWNDGEYDISSTCKVNTDTKEVLDVKPADSEYAERLEILDGEYIRMPNGEDVLVFSEDNPLRSPDDYWYKN